ncbi:MAG: DNA topoisomerase (ATP-hydrolyzing) subunit B [Muribaculaceae bacterium]|nr:DNA topoisomerase (ATP-hydrolyzing) subunit B [Muribaculaceae bacterium]
MTEEDFNVNEENEYSAHNIQVLEGLEAVRKRPAMYIGDISERGLHHLVYEVVDNSIDEALAGFAKHIDVTILEDNSIKVIDDGRGIPVDFHEKEQKSALEVVLTVLHAGGKFDKGSYKVSGGLHGVGVSCVNALSDYLRAEVHRDGKVYVQEYAYGKPTSEVRVEGESSHTGTCIIFHPDASIFTVTEYRYETLATHLRDLAFLNAGITLSITDLRTKDEEGNCRSEKFYSETGLKEFVQYIDQNRPSIINDIIHLNTESQGVPVEVALTYNGDWKDRIYSYVNNIHTIEGGTHVTGFKTGLGNTLKRYAEDNKLTEKAKVEIKAEDYIQGLTAVISVKVMEPQFEGQTKTKLGNSEVAPAVRAAVSNAMGIFLEENPQQAKTIVEKVVTAAQAREAALKARKNILRKSPLSGSGLPGKLSDCSSRHAEECEIFLVEGDSAGGTAIKARDSRFQAILPLRGKILNVEKALDHKVFESKEITNMFKALRVSLSEDGRDVSLDRLAYHKIIIMTDADVDGAHIATLLMTFFFRRMPSIIENGFLYIATPPLYKCSRGKNEEYCWTDAQVQKFIDAHGAGTKVMRYKGLGEMDAPELRYTTMSPEHRMLKQVHISDAQEADRIFTMLMGEDVGPRRDFIEANANYANIDA